MLYEYLCLNGHTREVFEHTPKDKGVTTPICNCGHTMGPIPSYGRGLLYFEEGRERIIENLFAAPVRVTSYRQHRELMKKAGVESAPAILRQQDNRNRKTLTLVAKGRWI